MAVENDFTLPKGEFTRKEIYEYTGGSGVVDLIQYELPARLETLDPISGDRLDAVDEVHRVFDQYDAEGYPALNTTLVPNPPTTVTTNTEVATINIGSTSDVQVLNGYFFCPKDGVMLRHFGAAYASRWVFVGPADGTMQPLFHDGHQTFPNTGTVVPQQRLVKGVYRFRIYVQDWATDNGWSQLEWDLDTPGTFAKISTEYISQANDFLVTKVKFQKHGDSKFYESDCVTEYTLKENPAQPWHNIDHLEELGQGLINRDAYVTAHRDYNVDYDPLQVRDQYNPNNPGYDNNRQPLQPPAGVAGGHLHIEFVRGGVHYYNFNGQGNNGWRQVGSHCNLQVQRIEEIPSERLLMIDVLSGQVNEYDIYTREITPSPISVNSAASAGDPFNPCIYAISSTALATDTPDLIKVDTVTNTIVSVTALSGDPLPPPGSFGGSFLFFSGAAFNPVDGKLYALASNAPQIFSIDVNTAVITFEGTITGWQANGGKSLAITPTGRFFIPGGTPGPGGNAQIYELTPGTWVATVVHTMATMPEGQGFSGMSSDQNGLLWLFSTAIDEAFTWDPEIGGEPQKQFELSPGANTMTYFVRPAANQGSWFRYFDPCEGMCNGGPSIFRECFPDGSVPVPPTGTLAVSNLPIAL